MYKIIPLTTSPNQSMTITIPINNKNVTLSLGIRYNIMGNYWYLSVKNTAGTILIDSLPIVSGEYPAANILEQYEYLNIGKAYVLNISNIKIMDSPDDTNLGTDFILVWGG